jgi:hypothetical protein
VEHLSCLPGSAIDDMPKMKTAQPIVEGFSRCRARM